ncbi:PAS and ANTAR domain-containing protein [Mycolicibacterium stellerae]|uniref:PAS and ANTAR domain-containing protein n=1 Tax=Mycolicibacterium stellerae TaxID=2358193 RepID=UPI000F0B9F6A|nr:PAS and ANTAR domain-containing protein [Mycolicibacterium stellerae]
MSQDSTVEQALAGGAPQHFGWYRFYFEDERWEWSPEVARIHGYEPGEVTPTTRLVLSHKHPEDYEQVAATLEDIRRTHKPFSTRHRIVTVAGVTREVVVIGERMHDNAGRVIGTQGFYIDVTPAGELQAAIITEAVAEITENRAAIEQAKGILMLVYRIQADAAFDLLKWRSQETNVKLRVLAEQLVADIRALEYGEDIPPRSTFDRLLLTVHKRVRAKAAGKHTRGQSPV